MGRLRDAVRALFAAEPSKQELMARMDMVELEWATTMDKLRKWSERQRKREERALSKQLEPLSDASTEQSSVPQDHKAELRARARLLRPQGSFRRAQSE